MIYDLVVVGNGLAAQTFLFELFTRPDVKKGKNFSVAQIYSEEIAASCSLRSTATVSLSGIEEGVSILGNELRESYFLFEEFQKKHQPLGIEKINQLVTSTSEKEEAKIIRRYKKLTHLDSALLKNKMEGAELSAFLIDPKILSDWFNDQINKYPLTQEINFITKIAKNAEGLIECTLLNKDIIMTRKIVLCTGAYAKIFSDFNLESDYLQNTQVVSGSFLERSINLNSDSFSITIDGCKLVYRSHEEKLILGSVTNPEGSILPDHKILKAMLDLFNFNCSFSLGEYSDFKIITGLRHKGVRRRPMASSIDVEKNMFAINGLYKNGYTFSHLCAKRVLGLINL